MDYEFAGMPVHVLLVHAIVILTPLLGVLLVVISVWPAARRVLWLPALAGAALLLPLGLATIEAGKWLEVRVPAAPLIQEHTAQGEDIVPWLIALFVMALAIAVWAIIERVAERRADTGEARKPARGVRIAVGAVLTLAAIGIATVSIMTLVQIGEAGSRAVWEGSFSEEPLER